MEYWDYVDGYIVDWDMFVWASIICFGDGENKMKYIFRGLMDLGKWVNDNIRRVGK